MSVPQKCALIFPGQGSQIPGMAQPWCQHPRFRDILTQAEHVLELPLGQVMQEGSVAQLMRTEIAQPALLTCAYGIFEVLRAECEIHPVAMAGHSLGEYTALCAAGVFCFSEALQLVVLRSRLMQEACARFPGGMVAVLRADLSALEALLKELALPVSIGNYNSPQQYVLSGATAPLQHVVERIRSLKLGRVLSLKVAGAFHSPLMAEAQAELDQALEATVFRPALYPVISNVDAEAACAPEQLRAKLQRQLLAPVQWEHSVRRLALMTNVFLETGPGQVLSALIRQTLSHAQTLDPEALMSNSITGAPHV